MLISLEAILEQNFIINNYCQKKWKTTEILLRHLSSSNEMGEKFLILFSLIFLIWRVEVFVFEQHKKVDIKKFLTCFFLHFFIEEYLVNSWVLFLVAKLLYKSRPFAKHELGETWFSRLLFKIEGWIFLSTLPSLWSIIN